MIGYFDHPRRWRVLVLSAVLITGEVGCHHRQAQPVVLPAQTPVVMAVPPQPASQPVLETPKTKLPPVPVVLDEPNPKKIKKQRTKSVASAAPVAPPPAAAPAGSGAGTGLTAASGPRAAEGEVGAAIPPAVPGGGDSVGVFTVGGDQSPRMKQDASNLIAANERRLTAANGEKVRSDPSLLSKVRNFQKEAQQALSSGDAEGARTLATKGKLLLDDMDRGVASQ